MSNPRHDSFRKTPFWRRRMGQAHFYASLGLIAVNLVVYLLTEINGVLVGVLALQPAAVYGEGAWWQLVTYMFVHTNFSHILYNMVFLAIAGMAVEQRMRSYEFLTFYLVCGTLSGLVYLLVGSVTGLHLTFLLGSSGAIYALILAYAVFGFEGRNLFIPFAFSLVFGAIQYSGLVIAGAVPLFSLVSLVQAANVIVVVAVVFRPEWMRNPFHIVFLFGTLDVISEAINPIGGVSNLTHLAGFVFAFFYLLIRYRMNAWTVYRS
ncbi:MAG: rhomboid family intramembrane serine protease [Spirochaetales bacterium]